jgi:multidrug resistance efflux pump
MHDHEHELGRSRRGSSPLRGHDGDAGRPDVEAQLEALAAQVRKLGERLATQAADPEPTPAPPPELGELRSILAGRVLAAAEAVSNEIRASAQREAERIRSGGQRGAAAQRELRAAVARQREGMATLIAETMHVEQILEVLRARMGVLNSELAALENTLRELDDPRDSA